LLEKVGLRKDQAGRFPHEFSGGQRQRVGIARALATNPDLIICDEPVSALDVSIQAQVINLMMDIQKEFDVSFLFIAHDLSVVEHISDKIAVMYLGNLMEFGDASQVYHHPMHPYSEALLSAVPIPNPKEKNRNRIVLKGDVPTPMNKPSFQNLNYMPRNIGLHVRLLKINKRREKNEIQRFPVQKNQR